MCLNIYTSILNCPLLVSIWLKSDLKRCKKGDIWEKFPLMDISEHSIPLPGWMLPSGNQQSMVRVLCVMHNPADAPATWYCAMLLI